MEWLPNRRVRAEFLLEAVKWVTEARLSQGAAEPWRCRNGKPLSNFRRPECQNAARVYSKRVLDLYKGEPLPVSPPLTNGLSSQLATRRPGWSMHRRMPGGNSSQVMVE